MKEELLKAQIEILNELNERISGVYPEYIQETIDEMIDELVNPQPI